MADVDSTLIIEELSGSAGHGNRRLVLTGPSLPLQGAEWSGENNVKYTFLPGNKRGTRQVIGPRLLPSTWTGEWHVDQLLETPAIWVDESTGSGEQLVAEPTQLFEIFEDIRSAARMLRVTWSVNPRQGAALVAFSANSKPISRVPPGTPPRTIVCEGGLDKFGAKFDRSEDATWDATFNWVSRGARQAPARSSGSDSLAVSGGRLSAAADSLAIVASGSPLQAFDPTVAGSASFLSLGRLEGLAEGLESLVLGAVTSIVVLAAGVAQAVSLGAQLTVPSAAVNQSAVHQARAAAAQARAALDRFGQVPFELTTNKPFFGDALAAWLRYQEVEQALEELAGEAVTLRDQLQAGQAAPSLGAACSSSSAQPGATRIHTCRAGETPESVSMFEYDTDQYAGLICAANNLPWHWPAFYAGQKLIIPPMRANSQP